LDIVAIDQSSETEDYEDIKSYEKIFNNFLMKCLICNVRELSAHDPR
jgi:hypothetical protein